ncbi:hypothetical protein D3C71_865830 [compost metagenome]
MLCCCFRHLGIRQRRAVLLQILQPTLQRRGLGQWRTAAQQITQCRQMQHRAIVVAALEVGHPQPAGVLRPGQGDIEQAQILGQTLIVSQGNQFCRRLQCDLGIAGFIVVVQRQAAAIHRFRRADERQEHQGVFKAFGLVDGHDLDQLLITFQTQDLLFASLPGQRQMLGQMPDQGLLAIEFSGGLLQQFEKVQKVGQNAFAVTAGDQSLGQTEVVQQASQHRQYALLAPDFAIATELHDPGLPGQLVLIQTLQFRQRQVQRDAGQRSPQRSLDIRLGAGLEPGQHVMRLLGGEHRVLVRQVNTAHTTGGQLRTNRLRLLAIAHQDGDVRR